MNPLIAAFMQRAFDGASHLPATARADLYEAASLLLQDRCKQESDAAMRTAIALREAEALQLQFRNFYNEGRAA